MTIYFHQLLIIVILLTFVGAKNIYGQTHNTFPPNQECTEERLIECLSSE